MREKLDFMPKVINPGDTVMISACGLTVRGTVKSAHNYGHGRNSNWYIEVESYDGPHYWKQSFDGGCVSKILTEV